MGGVWIWFQPITSGVVFNELGSIKLLAVSFNECDMNCNLTVLFRNIRAGLPFGTSKFCGGQPLENLKGHGLLKQTISLQIF